MPTRRFDSPLSVADQTFRLLTTGPRPLALDAGGLGLGPAGVAIALDQLRELLRSPRLQVEDKNRVWEVLIERSQTMGQEWTIGAVGVALPALVRLGTELAGANKGIRAELDAEILTGFLAALAAADSPRTRRFPVLLRAARNSGLAWLRHLRAADTPLCDLDDHRSAPPPPPYSHPDLVLAEAVAAGVLTTDEAELIGATRLEGRDLAALAAEHGVTANALWMRRDRAEQRLVAVLRAARANDTDDQADPTYSHALAAMPLGQRTRVHREPHASARRGRSVSTAQRTACGENTVSSPSYPQDGPRRAPEPAPDPAPERGARPHTRSHSTRVAPAVHPSTRATAHPSRAAGGDRLDSADGADPQGGPHMPTGPQAGTNPKAA